jgi:uncharacterized Zn finger protein
MGYGYYGFRPYVSVAQRRQNARQEMARLEKKGKVIEPIAIEGRKIAKTFWGQAWCDHLESFSDYANRLPRGRTYVRNGSVCHLAIEKGKVEAFVSGSELYNVTIEIETLPKKKWSALKSQCTGEIGSLLELLSGKLSESVMEVVTDRKQGLFPLPGEIEFECDCPDWASMCKHVAAVLYGVGSRLDHQPGLLFDLRGTAVEELIEADAEQALGTRLKAPGGKQLSSENLSDIFGIELADSAESPGDDEKPEGARTSSRRNKTAAKKPSKKASAKKKAGAPHAVKSAKTRAANSKKKASKAVAKKKTAKRKSAKKKGAKASKTKKNSS